MEPSNREDNVKAPVETGTVQKTSKIKHWNLKNKEQKRVDKYKKPQGEHEKMRKEKQLENYKNQLNMLTQMNDKYQQKYHQEKNILLFSMYEKQYNLHTKIVQHKSQKEITEHIIKENENLQNIIRMYNIRLDMNQKQVNKLIEYTNAMTTNNQNIEQDITKTTKDLTILETNYVEHTKRNYNLREQYITLIKKEMITANAVTLTTENKQIKKTQHLSSTT